MSNVVIDICIDNDAFVGGACGSELGRILRNLADSVEYSDVFHMDDMPLIDINGNKVGSFEVFIDEIEIDHGREDREKEFWDFVNQMTREDLVSTLEAGCGVQCYDHENASMLRHALVQCLHDGDTDLESLRYFFGDKYR